MDSIIRDDEIHPMGLGVSSDEPVRVSITVASLDGMTPAMAAGVTSDFWTVENLVETES